MNNRQRLVLLVTGLFLILLCGGLSYAFFSSINNNESSSTIFAKGGTMKVTYSDSSGNINIKNIYPKDDAWVSKEFIITGDKSVLIGMKYRIILVVENNTFTFPLTYSISGSDNWYGYDDQFVNAENVEINKYGYQVLGEGNFSETVQGKLLHY